MTKCLCGCGEEVKLGNKYIHGHNWKGKHHTKESKDKISEHHSPNSAWSKGKHFSETHIENISDARKDFCKCIKGKTYEEIYGEERAKEIREKQRNADPARNTRGKTYEEIYGEERAVEVRRKNSESHEGYVMPQEQRDKISETNSKITKELWKDKIYREKHIRGFLKTILKRPTSLEQKVISICELYTLPFKYVGDGQVIIAGKNPDFIETNGKKLLIESYGFFWHEDNYEEERRKVFAPFGYKTLFLGEDVLESKLWTLIVSEEILCFMGR